MAGDRTGALALWRALHDEHEALDARYRLADDAASRWTNSFALWVKSDADRVFVADAGPAGLVGLATVHLTWPAPVYAPRLTAYVDDLFVTPAWRGDGIGRGLLDAVCAWARAAGAKGVEAGVLAQNEEALAFWRRAGAAPFGVNVALPL